MPRSTKWEIESINAGMKSWQRYTGENLLYFEYNPDYSGENPIYSEGDRAWHGPFTLPVMFIDFEQSNPISPDGLYSTQVSSFTFQVSEAIGRFRIDPLNTDAHFRDRFAYGNPMSLYSIRGYERQGLLHGTYLTITVRGIKVQNQEFFLDYGGEDRFLGRTIY